MTSLALRYPDAAEVAREVRRVLAPDFGERISARPYNPYQASDTTWWVTPTTEWPAFAHGKFGFSPRRTAGSNQLLVGLTVEKGLSPEAVKMLGSPRGWAMNGSWIWPDFLRGMPSHELDAAMQELRTKTDTSPTVHVEAWYGRDRPADPEEEGPRGDWIRLAGDASALELQQSESRHDLLAKAGRSNTLAELGENLAAIEGLDWIWVDVWIGLLFDLRSEPGAWDAVAVTDRVLQPWMAWFR